MAHAVAEDVVEFVDSLAGVIAAENADRLAAGTSGRHSIDDLMQEVRLRAVEGFEAFGDCREDSFRKWVLTIAQNVRKSMISRERAQRRDAGKDEVSINAVVEEFGREPGFCRDTVADCLREIEQQSNAVFSAMNRLSPRAAYIVQKIYLEQQSYDSLAKELKVSVNALRLVVSRSLAQIRAETIQIGSPDGDQIEFEVPDEAVRVVRRRKGQFKFVPMRPKPDRSDSQEPSPGE